MCAPSPPPPPDLAGAATAQGAANKDAAIATGLLSNPNIISAAGTRKVSYAIDPITGNAVPTVEDKYSPKQQELYDKNINLQGLMADLGIGAAEKAQGVLGTPLNLDSGIPESPDPRSVGTAQSTRDRVYEAMMSRVNDDYDTKRDRTSSNLIARGHAKGTPAYEREMAMLERGQNDARQQAILGAGQEASRDFGMDVQSSQLDFGQGMDARRQAITELLAQRQLPLNEINAFRSGSQIAPLQFQNYTGATVQPTPIMAGALAQQQAQQNAYNQQVAGQNSMMSGLFSLGGAALGMV